MKHILLFAIFLKIMVDNRKWKKWYRAILASLEGNVARGSWSWKQDYGIESRYFPEMPAQAQISNLSELWFSHPQIVIISISKSCEYSMCVK